MKSLIKRALRNVGYDIIKFAPRGSASARLQHYLQYLDIDLVLDVGANIGQYARLIRELNYKGKIVSFEPLASAYETLLTVSKSDPLWDIAPRMALGDKNGTIKINVSGNSQSSSALNLLDSHLKVAPDSAYISVEDVQLGKLSTVVKPYLDGERLFKKVFLKIDVQGLEDKVLEGSLDILNSIVAIQLELSMIPLYEKELLYKDMFLYLETLGYELYDLSPVICDPESARVLQMDGIFVKKSFE
jgi:FkbM family methyltransferase